MLLKIIKNEIQFNELPRTNKLQCYFYSIENVFYFILSSIKFSSEINNGNTAQ